MKINNKVLNVIVISIYVMTLLLGNNLFLGMIEINENIINYGIVIVPTLLILLILIVNIRNIKYLFDNKLNMLLVVMFFIWCFITIFMGINIGMQNIKTLIHFGIVFSLLILFSKIEFTDEQIKTIKRHLFISFGITLLYGIIEYIFNFNLDVYSNGKYPGMKGRIYSTFYIATLYDKYIAMMSAFVCYELLNINTKNNRKIMLWILIFLSGIVVALTFSRTGLLLYIANLMLLIVVFLFKKRYKEILLTLCVFLCIFSLPGVKYSFESSLDLIYSSIGLKDHVQNGNNTNNDSKDESDNNNQDSSQEYRDYYKSVGKELIKENPVWGIGVGNYSYLYNNQNAVEYLTNKDVITHKYMYPHSSYIQLGAECGYIGVFLFYAAIASSLMLLKNKKSKVLEKILLIYVFLQMLAIGYVEGVIYAKQYIYLFMIIFGLYLNTSSNEKIIKCNKLSFLLLHLGYGGIESATINTANSLCDDYDIEIMSFYKLSKTQANKLNDKINVKYLYDGGPNKEEFLDAFHNHKIFNILKEGIRSVSILTKKKIRVINYIKNCDSKYIVSTRYDFSVLLSKYGNDNSVKIAQEHHYHNNNKRYINILKNKYYNIDYLFALTKTLEDDYKKFLIKNKHTKVVLVPNMLYYIPSKQSKLDKKNIITISRLDYGKRNDDIIKAFSKIKENDWKLYIIGDGKEFNNLNKLINDLNMNDRIILTGYKNKEEIEEYMLKSSLFLMASETEGLPMVLLEAMSYGIPCIAYEIASGVNDIIDNNKNGYIIKNRNEEEYIEKIEKVINDSKLRNELGIEAKNKANEFSKEKIVNIWKKILK